MSNYILPFKNDDKVIELGGGTIPMFRPNLDVRAAENVDIVADFNEKLPLEDKLYDGIFSKFCIEHLSWRKVLFFMQECARILKDGGTAVFITANTERQMEWVLEQDEWDKDSSCIIFGDQDYPDNTHRNSLCPKYAVKLLSEAGFDNIIVIPWGDLGTDMLIEASKQKEEERQDMGDNNIEENRADLFDANYFNGGAKVGGYAYEGYWDYPVHWLTFQKLMSLKPESVLEIGAARGYIVRRFEQAGIYARGLEISKHCHLTRVTDAVVEFDIMQTPWPFKDGEFDLCYSIAVMEHIPEEALPKIAAEMARVSKRGLHGIDFGENDDGFDNTHCTLHTREWWLGKLPPLQEVCDKEEMEKGALVPSIPAGDDDLLKLNLGSFVTMLHNGWINADIIDVGAFAQMHHYKFVHMDATKPTNLEDGVVDFIVSSHMIEHLDWNEGLIFLKECYRILKPTGVIRISCPDIQKLCQLYLDNRLQEFDELNVVSRLKPVQSYKLWSLIFDGHKIAHDWQSLLTLGTLAGFKVERKQFNEGNEKILSEAFDYLPDLSIYIELTKP